MPPHLNDPGSIKNKNRLRIKDGIIFFISPNKIASGVNGTRNLNTGQSIRRMIFTATFLAELVENPISISIIGAIDRRRKILEVINELNVRNQLADKMRVPEAV